MHMTAPEPTRMRRIQTGRPASVERAEAAANVTATSMRAPAKTAVRPK
jgi:hypothetical protein